MRKIKNLYHKIIALVLLVLLVVVAVITSRQDPAVMDKPEETRHPQLIDKKRGDFFSVGKYGNTLILEVYTERTNDEQS
jgi:hypothetical protein